ncbi:MAG: hypothetical protein OXH75_29320 [Acidobacteria bacterium]|nr:hypothetical protein [Acidobacteriota bacterium]
MEPKAIVEQLKAYGQTRADSDWNELDAETRRLIRKSPFAFLIAVAFDRGMPWQRVWRIPTEINRQGLLDPVLLASKSEMELIGLLDSLAVRPRYGARRGARTLSDAARLVRERFGGDASAIWRNASPAKVEKTLQEIHGVGAGIASMATRILRDDFGCFKGQERQIDVKPDVHVVRVFRRLGIIDGNSATEAVRAARHLNPEFPGQLDWPAWQIGQHWCHQTRPDCARCPLTGDCAKRL